MKIQMQERTEIMIIDSHQHVLLPNEKQLKIMTKAGLDLVILFCTTIHPETATDTESFAREIYTLSEILNGNRNAQAARFQALKEQLSVIKEYPNKFIGFGTVPLGLSEGSTAEWIKENVITNNFRGLGEFTLTPGQVRQLDPIFSAATAFNNLPLWIHTFAPLTLDDIKDINKLSRKYPRIPVILGHLGGTNWLDTIKLAKENPSLYLDLSATFATIAVSFAIKELPDRTLFSSDAPYGDPVLARNTIERVAADNYIRDRVLGENISELLKL
ncbi:amidohydrolase family protein [Desulfosporosinus sp. FKA]|uniref:amidohydrolase family protein n=1 Tax=Desulfosporosinus sp. FKA TaxID=1969834 RepID=UPI0032B82C3E